MKAGFCSSCGRGAKFSHEIHQEVCIECDELPRACECDPVDTDPPDFCPRCGRRTVQVSFSGERICSLRVESACVPAAASQSTTSYQVPVTVLHPI